MLKVEEIISNFFLDASKIIIKNFSEKIFIRVKINFSRKIAFTLAEVLIVLGIIGIVAEMTIPTLMNSVQDAQYKAGAKKAYSVASQAVTMMQADGNNDFASYAANTQTFKAAFMTYFRVMQDCGMSSCFPTSGYKTLDGAIASQGLMDDGQFISADGMLWMFENYSGSGLLLISADVNGAQKPPNKFGVDVYTFQLMTDGTGRLLPMGASGTYLSDINNYCNRATSNTYNGMACMYYIMQSKDY